MQLTNHHHLPYNPKLVERAKELRKNMTKAERKLWYEYLKNFQYRVHRQRPIDQFIVDFYCPELKLVIEIDGDSHNSEDAQSHDLERTQILAGYGLTVIRFTNQEVLSNFEGVCGVIASLIPPTPLDKGGFDPPNPP
ncbi:MAG: endonuclease domain-containing protein [Microcystis aeruginosa L211-07]|nr:endonuclease domain-containing protein [Microcystis aeruginosa L211-07]